MAMAYLGHFIVHVKNLNMWWMWMVINIFEIFTTVPLMVAVAPLTVRIFSYTHLLSLSLSLYFSLLSFSLFLSSLLSSFIACFLSISLFSLSLFSLSLYLLSFSLSLSLSLSRSLSLLTHSFLFSQHIYLGCEFR